MGFFFKKKGDASSILERFNHSRYKKRGENNKTPKIAINVMSKKKPIHMPYIDTLSITLQTRPLRPYQQSSSSNVITLQGVNILLAEAMGFMIVWFSIKLLVVAI